MSTNEFRTNFQTFLKKAHGPSEASTNPEIRMLRGEDSFEVDNESLLLRPDPNTGELRFPPTDGDEESASSE